jgi:hypothetical protein
VTWLVLGVFVFMAICVMMGAALKPSKAGETPSTAYQRCEHVMRKNLNDPESAIFSDKFYQRRNDGNFEVGGVVRARNGFGGMVRQNWTMIISPNLDFIYSKVGKTESGVYPEDSAPR